MTGVSSTGVMVICPSDIKIDAETDIKIDVKCLIELFCTVSAGILLFLFLMDNHDNFLFS